VHVHRDKAEGRGRALAAKLKEVIPHQQYQVAFRQPSAEKLSRAKRQRLPQGCDAKCYGGDITRKRKLLEKQRKAKKRMKALRHGQHSAGSIYRGVKSMKRGK